MTYENKDLRVDPSQKRVVNYTTVHCPNIDDFNQMEHMLYQQTRRALDNGQIGTIGTFPRVNGIEVSKDGNVVFMRLASQASTSNVSGLQIYYENNGRIWLRNIENNTGHEWKQLSIVGQPTNTNLELIENIDTMNKSGIFRTDQNTNTLPSVSDKHGVLHSYLQTLDAGTGYQMWVGSGGDAKGKVYVRALVNNRGEAWREFGSGGNSPSVDLTPYIKKPESHTETNEILQAGVLKDANKRMPSGMYKTDSSTQHLPADIPNDKKWGVLLQFNENADTGACYQIFAPIDGDQNQGGKKGYLYMRIMTSNKEQPNISDWFGLNIPVLANINSLYWQLPKPLSPNEVNANLPTGFYLTNDQTTGMEGISQNKTGVLKVVKTANASIQEYTSSTAGDNKIYVRTLPLTVTTSARQGQKPFHDITEQKEAYVTIHKNYAEIDSSPHVYATLKEKVVYEIKFPETIKLKEQLQFGNENGYVILKTLIGDDIEAQGGQTTEQKYGFILQYAYSRDGRVFTRKYKHNTAGMNPDENTQFDNWKEVTSSGGTSPSSESFDVQLQKEIKGWEGSGSATYKAEQEFIKWHTRANEVRYKGWNTNLQTMQQDTEGKALHDLILTVSNTGGGETVNYTEWANYYKNKQ